MSVLVALLLHVNCIHFSPGTLITTEATEKFVECTNANVSLQDFSISSLCVDYDPYMNISEFLGKVIDYDCLLYNYGSVIQIISKST